ncbi:DUF397 domain-containing protein [Amycolatopsis sp.]|jgi:hypothetical protein|uniref:DUF397 domain-containing protein n=1 Tax=Amycolatopsis sp. TaxID=37632 RepID=UPI002E098CC3|nr:DUF397 domain-containing protein [Amycolatopsis sp.]
MMELVGWKKSSYSGNNSDCVEVALGETVGVRDTKDRDRGALVLTSQAWSALLGAVRG